MSQGQRGSFWATFTISTFYYKSTASWLEVMGGVVAHVKIVSAQGPNPSFHLFWVEFIQLGGLLGQGLGPGPGPGLEKCSCSLNNFFWPSLKRKNRRKIYLLVTGSFPHNFTYERATTPLTSITFWAGSFLTLAFVWARGSPNIQCISLNWDHRKMPIFYPLVSPDPL